MIPPDGIDGTPGRSRVFFPRTYDPRCQEVPTSIQGSATSYPAFSTWTASADKRKSAAYRVGIPGMTRPFSDPYAESSHKIRRTPFSQASRYFLTPHPAPKSLLVRPSPASWGRWRGREGTQVTVLI